MIAFSAIDAYIFFFVKEELVVCDALCGLNTVQRNRRRNQVPRYPQKLDWGVLDDLFLALRLVEAYRNAPWDYQSS